MKKTILFILLPIFMLVLFLTGCNGSNNKKTDESNLIDSARKIKIVQMEGSAKVTDEKETLDCYVGMNLYSGDNVEVAKSSVLVVKFDDDKYVYLGEETKINILSVGNSKYKTNVYIEKGTVLAEIQNKLGEDEEFFLSSNNSVMAVRGTIFGLQVTDLGNSYQEVYSVYKGVTELFLADKKENEIITGVLKDLSNIKIEVNVPKSHALTEDEFNNIISNWLKDEFSEFTNEDNANSILDEVEIKTSTPSKSDYQQVIDTIGDGSVSYSQINYSAKGYFGFYDGNSHSISVNVDDNNAKVYYKDSEKGTYSENNFEYVVPGNYTVYYKIECEGYDTKEDYKVINIEKADLTIEKTNDYSDVSNGYVSGMDASCILDKIDINSYYTLSGVQKDSNYIANATYSILGTIEEGSNSYNVYVNLPDDIKDCYNDAIIVLSDIVAYSVVYNNTNSLASNVLDLTTISSYTKYNGVSFGELNSTSGFVFDDNIFDEYKLNEQETITYSYDKIVDDYIELKDGKNTFTAHLPLKNGTIFEMPVTFTFNDQRDDVTINYGNGSVESLGNNNYYYSTDSGDDLSITNNALSGIIGLESNNYTVYCNLPISVSNINDITGENFNYGEYSIDSTTSLTLKNGQFNSFELIVFPTSSNKSYRANINVYYGQEAPNMPTYTVNDKVYKYNSNGVQMDFVESENIVTYSLDGTNYNETLVINETGKFEVYYKVINGNIEVVNKKQVIIEKALITSNNLSLISDSMALLSNDNGNLAIGSVDFNVISNDGSTISSFDDVYKIYSDTLKNSEYYDSVTKEKIDCTVEVLRISQQAPDFSYVIKASGYEDLTGSVTFDL
ncbi:MAG: FecR domain-containing protein, partial [Acholeplasmatales bacterium]|nr:FecR domain-containing protein [Acholeplasmatales bacterium]